jgi:hypothetical protein
MTPETARAAVALFVKAAETRLCHEPDEETREIEGKSMMRISAMLVPYNKAKVDRLYVWLTDETITVQVAGQTPSPEGAEYGFTSVSAKAETNAQFDAAGLCQFFLALAKGMR